MKIDRSRQLLLFTAITLIVTLGLASGTIFNNSLEEKTVKADENTGEQAEIENVYWRFDDGKIVEGRLTLHRFEEGTHNLTVTVVRSNGEKEIHRGQVSIRK